MASSLARPPALRITGASPSAKPAYFAGSRRASMHVRIANRLPGGSGSFPFSPKLFTYWLFAERTSLSIWLMGDNPIKQVGLIGVSYRSFRGSQRKNFVVDCGQQIGRISTIAFEREQP